MSSSSASTYRCFLFADLRGYTSFIERAGNAAGVELLDAYLGIMRREVARHEGAEIKVEGDGFHAVFPSASAAVMCGLAIAAEARDASAAHPDRPINVGIGIHAGEAVETADGFIGSAVNIAARVCGAAAAGEVLVTATVRGITHASIPVDFESRGRKRLKGIGEPIELFGVVAEGATARRRSGLDRRWLAGAAALGAVGVGVLAIAFVLSQSAGPLAKVSPTPGVSVAPGLPPAVGPLGVGRYAASDFLAPFGFVISEPGWALYRNDGEAMGFIRESDPLGQLDVALIDQVYTNPCGEGGGPISAGHSPNELVAALRQIPYLAVSNQSVVGINGRAGQRIDVDVDPGAQAACGSFGSGGFDVFPTGSESWKAQAGERFRLTSLDVDGMTVTMLQSADAQPSASVPALEQFFETSDRLLQTLTF